MTGERPHPHRLLLVGGLFLLAPLIGEYLFGNIAITELPAILVLASLYGGGAVQVTRSSTNSATWSPCSARPRTVRTEIDLATHRQTAGSGPWPTSGV